MSHTNAIFISYKSQERQYAFAVRDQLRSWGYDTWLDVDNLPLRAEWADEYDWQEDIDSALKSAAAVVAVVTEAAVSSRYVTAEWDIAVVQNKPLLLLVYETAPIPTRFHRIARIERAGDSQAVNIDELKQQLGKALGSSLFSPDPFHAYLTALFERVSVQLGQLMIKTLSTYGADGRVAGEPIRLTVKTDDNLTFEQFDDAFVACGERAVLAGEAGSGKTIILLNAVRDAVIARLQDKSLPLPVFASIATWEIERRISVTDWLCQSSTMQTELKPVIEAGEALLLLDGLDEIAAANRSLSTGVNEDPRLLFLNALPARNQVVVTCRAQDYASIKGRSPIRRAITLNLLTDIQTRDYLRDQPEVLAAIESDSNLRDLLRTPLLLSFFAFTYERMTTDERYRFHQLRDAGEIREMVFEQFVRRRYEHETKKRGAALPFELAEVKRVLGQLALEDAAAPFFTNRIHVRSLEALLGGQLASFTDLMIQLHLFVVIDATFFRFIHLLVRDYFAFEPALSALRDKDRYVRQRAARALKAIRDRRALDPLIEAVKDRDPQVRLEAVGALGQLGGEQVVETLMTVLRSADESLVQAAEEGMKNLARSNHSAQQALSALEKISPSTIALQATEKWYTLLWRAKDSPVPSWIFFLIIACGVTAIIPTAILNNGTAGILLTSVVYGTIFVGILYMREKNTADTKRRKEYADSLRRIIYTLPQNMRDTIWWAKGKF